MVAWTIGPKYPFYCSPSRQTTDFFTGSDLYYIFFVNYMKIEERKTELKTGRQRPK